MPGKYILLLLLFVTLNASGQSAAVKYVEAYKEAAIRIMNENGIPASIVLGIAIHESGSGTSKIARILNNHFGFKGSNTSKEIKSAYKGYESVEASYADFAKLLTGRSKFRPLFDKYSSFDYYGWTRGIEHAGYAHSKTWGNQVIAIIKKYELYKYDNRPADYVAPALEETLPTPKVSTHTTATPEFVYKVKAGDTLSEIAQKYRTTVKNIQKINALNSTRLSIGQKLKIIKGE